MKCWPSMELKVKLQQSVLVLEQLVTHGIGLLSRCSVLCPLSQSRHQLKYHLVDHPPEKNLSLHHLLLSLSLYLCLHQSPKRKPAKSKRTPKREPAKSKQMTPRSRSEPLSPELTPSHRITTCWISKSYRFLKQPGCHQSRWNQCTLRTMTGPKPTSSNSSKLEPTKDLRA